MSGHWDLSAAARPGVRENLVLRHQVKQAARRFLSKAGFIEVDTPILAPELSEYEGGQFHVTGGGFEFYLPQSPQVFKQALIAAGIERYFQMAHCFRLDLPDPDRRDRAMEFMQIDFELVGDTSSDVMIFAEALVRAVFAELGLPKDLKFPTIDASTCVERYGSDKPDLRSAPDEFSFLWVVDFPLIDGMHDGRPQPGHHAFALPHAEVRNRPLDELATMRTHTYDLVLNGVEIGGGDLRVHDRAVQEALLDLFGVDHGPYRPLLDVLGAQIRPHGGMAIGLDRLLMVSLGLDDVSDVIAFPLPLVMPRPEEGVRSITQLDRSADDA